MNRPESEAEPTLHGVLHDALDGNGLTWGEVATLLERRGHRVPVATMRDWCYGLSVPSTTLERTAIPALEVALGLPVTTLDRLLPPNATPPAITAPLQPRLDDAELYQLLTERPRRPDAPHARTVAIYETLVIGADGELREHLVRQLVRATGGSPDGLLIWFQTEGPRGTPYVLPLRNCTLGAVADVPERALLACDLRFGRRLSNGESHSLEYLVGQVGPADPETSWERTCLRPLRELHIEVSFDPSALPSSVETFTAPLDRPEDARVVPLEPSITQLHFDFGPGSAGVRWTW